MSEYMLDIKELGISFGGLRVVDDFYIQIKKGQLYGLIGPNGAGKTTVFNLLTGVYQRDSGSIMLDGKSIAGLSTAQINREGVARTFQNIRLFNKMSVLDNVKTALHDSYKYSVIDGILKLPRYKKTEDKMDQEAKELLEIFNLTEFMYDFAENLSYGKQRELEIVRAMATKPKFLLLDEPAAGMNPSETTNLMNTVSFIREKFDLTILLIEHDMKLVSGICEELTVLNFGRVLTSGKTEEVLSNPEVIKAYLGD